MKNFDWNEKEVEKCWQGVHSENYWWYCEQMIVSVPYFDVFTQEWKDWNQRDDITKELKKELNWKDIIKIKKYIGRLKDLDKVYSYDQGEKNEKKYEEYSYILRYEKYEKYENRDIEELKIMVEGTAFEAMSRDFINQFSPLNEKEIRQGWDQIWEDYAKNIANLREGFEPYYFDPVHESWREGEQISNLEKDLEEYFKLDVSRDVAFRLVAKLIDLKKILKHEFEFENDVRGINKIRNYNDLDRCRKEYEDFYNLLRYDYSDLQITYDNVIKITGEISHTDIWYLEEDIIRFLKNLMETEVLKYRLSK